MTKFKYDQTNIHLSYDKSRRLPQETIALWMAKNHLECFEKINLRGYSDLASIPDEEFNEGLARMKRYCFEQEKGRSVFEDVDLFVFHVA